MAREAVIVDRYWQQAGSVSSLEPILTADMTWHIIYCRPILTADRVLLSMCHCEIVVEKQSFFASVDAGVEGRWKDNPIDFIFIFHFSLFNSI